MAKAKQIKIKLVRSLIGCSPAQRKVVAALGLKKKDQVVEQLRSEVMAVFQNVINELIFYNKCLRCDI